MKDIGTCRAAEKEMVLLVYSEAGVRAGKGTF